MMRRIKTSFLFELIAATTVTALTPLSPAIAEEYRYLEEKNMAFVDEVFYVLGDDADIRLTKTYIDRGWEYCSLRDQGIPDGQIIRDQIDAVLNSGLSRDLQIKIVRIDSVLRHAATEYLCTEYNDD